MRSSTRLNGAPALLGAALLLAASLAGCSALPGLGGCDAKYDSGDASSTVTATGKVGDKPQVDFPTPLVASKKPEVSVISAGDGALILPGDQVDYDFTILDGKTGESLGGSGYDGEQFSRTPVGAAGNSVGTGFECQTVGSRLAVVTRWGAAKAAFSADAEGSMDDDATVVVVIDAVATYLGKADGFNQLPRDGYPTVVTQVDGKPGITVPAEPAPKKSGFSVIKAGDGATLKTDDLAIVQYSLWTWPETAGDPPDTLGTTWNAPYQAATLGLTSISQGGGVPDALLKALVGQKVGSQILAIITPGEDSFPAGQGPAADNATYIFVIDILGVQKPGDAK